MEGKKEGADLAVRPAADADPAADFLEDGGADAEAFRGLVDGEVEEGREVLEREVRLVHSLAVAAAAAVVCVRLCAASVFFLGPSRCAVRGVFGTWRRENGGEGPRAGS